VLAGIIVILLMAKIGGDLFERVKLPAVLGELCVGILLGNAAFLAESTVGVQWHPLDFLHAPDEVDLAEELRALEAELIAPNGDPAAHGERIAGLRERITASGPYNPGAILKMLAEIGVVLLLFEVGLESRVRDMLSVGASSMLVAVLGVIAPMILGYGVGHYLLPDRPWQVHVFLGATLCATSVGITARVLKDLGCSQLRESRIVLGAAVIDDVLGLIVLAVVKGIIEAGEIELMTLGWIIVKAIGFLFGAVVLGTTLFTRPMFRMASFLQGHGLLVVTALVICFGFSWLASVMGLAPIVGAFAAGLILERAHYQRLGEREEVELEEALAPLTAVLVPIFFVQMGIMVKLESFLNPSVWGLAAALTAAAVIGKQVCALGVLEKGLDRLSVGIGMIPRGEVGLIFAAVGMALRMRTPDGAKVPVILDSTYSAVVVMVILTTLITPPVLKWSLGRGRRVAAEETPRV
jgi:Kef-type K+ transport system membrane component KefB